MEQSMKKVVILLLFGVWASLFAVHAAEAFGYFEDTREHSDQSIEQTMLTPADLVPQFSVQLPVLRRIPAILMDWLGRSFLSNPEVLQLNSHPFLFVDDGSPPGSPPPLFQLFLNLRL